MSSRPRAFSGKRVGVLVCTSALAIGSVPVMAQQVSHGAQRPADTAGAATVVKDPDTGKLRAPTAEEAAELRRAQPAAARQRLAPRAAPAARVSDSGVISMTLGEEHMVYTVLRRNADGSLSEVCVTGTEAAERVVEQISAQGVVGQTKKGLENE